MIKNWQPKKLFSLCVFGVILALIGKFVFADSQSQTLTANNIDSVCYIYNDGTYMDCGWKSINAIDINAFDNYPDIVHLSLSYNDISDISSLANLQNLQELYLDGNEIEDLSDLLGLTNLYSLNLSNNKIDDISSIAGLTNLNTLNLSNNKIGEIPDLSGLTNLISLYLNYNKINDINNIGYLPNLVYLYLGNNEIEDLPDLSNLTSLRYLQLENNKINDISNIGCLENLQRLFLYGNEIENLPDLSCLTNLYSLNLQNNKISDISNIGHLPNLINLYLNNNKIEDLPDLSGLSNLNDLDLGYNNIENINSSISTLVNLNSLHLQNNKISDISNINDLQNLTYLDLYNNEIENLPNLSSLTNLQSLNLQNNKISDISNIGYLPNLQRLYLNNNEIEDLPSFINLPSLTTLDLSENHISDFSNLNTTGLPMLHDLNLSKNLITVIVDLHNLSLESLNLSYNKIKDLATLNNNLNIPNLGQVDLSNNQIESVIPLSNFDNLWRVDLSENCIDTNKYEDVLESLAGDVNYKEQYLCYKGVHYTQELSGNDVISKTAILELVGGVTLPESAYTHTFYKNGSYEFILPDMYFADRQGKIIVTADGITDKTSPSCDIIYKIDANNNVVAELTGCNEQIYVKNNNGSRFYTFHEAGTYEFQFEDDAGNGATKQAIMYRDSIQCNNLWDNDNPIDENFWDLNPNTEEIVCALYGKNSTDKTAYTNNWGDDWFKSCNPKIMNVIEGNTLPSNLSKNTIYILDSKKIEINDSISIPECSAIIGKQKTSIISKNKNLNDLIHRQGYSFNDILQMGIKGFSEVSNDYDDGEFDDLDSKYDTYNEYYDFAMDYLNKYIKRADNFIILDNLRIDGGYSMDDLSDFIERFDEDEDIFGVIQSGEIGILLLGNYNSINNITFENNIIGGGILLSSGNSISNITAKSNLGGFGLGIVDNSEVKNIYTYQNLVGFGIGASRYDIINDLESYNSYVYGAVSVGNKNIVINNAQIYNNQEGGMSSYMDIMSLNNIQFYNNGIGFEVDNDELYDVEIILNNVQIYNNERGLDVGDYLTITTNNMYIYNNDVGLYGSLDDKGEGWVINVYGKFDYIYNNSDDSYDDSRYNNINNYINASRISVKSQPNTLFSAGIMTIAEELSGQCFTNPMNINGDFLIDLEDIQDKNYKSIRYANDEFEDEVISHVYSCIENKNNTMEASAPISYEGDEIVVSSGDYHETIGYLIPVCQVKYTPRTYTSGNVVASLINCDGKIITGENSLYEFTSNGTGNLEYRDLSGNPAFVTANVFRIDRDAPICEIEYTQSNNISGPMQAKLICTEDVIGETLYTFTGDEEHVFIVQDNAGNQSIFTGKISNSASNNQQSPGGSSSSITSSSNPKSNTGDKDSISTGNNQTHNSAEDEFIPDTGLFDGMFSDEMNIAYQFAYKHGITTMSHISKADMWGNLTRIAMAKMLSNYAINVLGITPDTTRANTFGDISEKLDNQYNNGVTLAYQLGIMGINMPNNQFRPFDTVTRAEFATALSRLIYHIEDGKEKYYSTHINLLHQLGIISNTDPNLTELRGYVMLMLLRSKK